MKILITGHSSLISQSLATSLLKEGHEVYMTARVSQAPFDERVKLIALDFNRPNLDEFKLLQFDGVVLNAMSATPKLKSFHKQDLESDNLDFLRNNIEANILLLQTILPSMMEKKLGRIILISSMIVEHPMAGYSIYGAIKAALESVIKSVAFEYGKYNICANTLRLGIFETERNKRFREKLEEKMTKNISLGKLGKPHQLDGIVSSLLAEDSYISGTEIKVAGGLFIPN